MAQAVALIIIAVLTVTDQLLKLLVESRLKPVGSINVISNVFQLHYIENTGAAFSLFAGKTYLLAAFTTVAIAVGLFALMTKRINSKYLYFCITLIIAGGIGNLIDRVFRGYVIAYLEFLFVNFAVFNFADCLVTVGALLVIGYLIWDMIQDSKKKKESGRE
jgi:signal peptidase II